jgi:hypothetical protein
VGETISHSVLLTRSLPISRGAQRQEGRRSRVNATPHAANFVIFSSSADAWAEAVMWSFRPLTPVAASPWLLSAAPATAYRWYPGWCCNDNDCRKLDEEKGETVLEAPNGWHFWEGRVFARGSERLSPDG